MGVGGLSVFVGNAAVHQQPCAAAETSDHKDGGDDLDIHTGQQGGLELDAKQVEDALQVFVAVVGELDFAFFR